MIVQVLLGAVMIVVTTVNQGIFTITGIEMLRWRLSQKLRESLVRSTLTLSFGVLCLVLATIIEVWTWALLYLALGAVSSLEQAAYFSTVTFTTLGFGDITLDENWRLLSSFEAANGLLMFGWSTALVFAIVQWVYRPGRKLSGHS